MSLTDQDRIETAAENCEVLRARLARYEDAEGNPIAQPSGVVLPPRAKTLTGNELDTQLAEAYNDALDEVARLNSSPVSAGDDAQYPPCDYCAKPLSYHPWHGSGLINGFESRHIHACDKCRHLLPIVSAGVVDERAADALEFADIEGFPEYKVSSDGIIYRKENGNLISQQSNDKGYLTVNLSNACGPVRMTTHRVVLESFVGKRPEGMQARHVDGNPANNRLSNLCWGTAAENEADKAMHGTKAVGSKNGASKLTEEMVREIIAARDSGGRFWGAKAFAEKFGVNLSTIIRVASGRHWAETSAALSAPSHGEQVQEGWKLVPVKPSIDMVEAGYEASLGRPDRGSYARVIEQYDAMLAAAPSAASQGGDV